MQAFFDPRQSQHNPQHFMRMGVQAPNPEQPERAQRLLAGVQDAGWQVRAPDDHGVGPIAAIHSADYLTFLRTIHAQWQAMPGASDEVIPNVHPRGRGDSYPSGPIGLAGWHQSDTACPITAQTWDSAYWSAQTALSAVEAARVTGLAYALCRPPGHHAFSDSASGFCFLNNAAIAAQSLRDSGHRVAVLDVDVHHGNGTQGIFYDRGDVLTLSVHGDPEAFYPFFWGHAHERGQGVGQGANLNLPLPMGSGDTPYLQAVDQALTRAALFGADALVVALGLDAHESDPFQALRVTTDGFHALGRRLGALSIPIVLVQEGGYLSDALRANLSAVLTGVMTAR
ncbi:MAG: histone deacetylase family protein [Primorskyibacter sp.]